MDTVHSKICTHISIRRWRLNVQPIRWVNCSRRTLTRIAVQPAQRWCRNDAMQRDQAILQTPVAIFASPSRRRRVQLGTAWAFWGQCIKRKLTQEQGRNGAARVRQCCVRERANSMSSEQRGKGGGSFTNDTWLFGQVDYSVERPSRATSYSTDESS